VTVAIRDARPDEYEAIGELVVLAYAGLDDDDPDYVDELRDTARRAGRVPVLVAVEGDGPPLGTVTYVPGPGPYAESEADDEAGIRMLAVAPWAQGRGIGRALAEHVVERARSDGLGGIAILTRPSMRTAHRLYESLGFVRDEASDWEFAPGSWLWGYRLRF
jgi:ribosomal protein S18 acetylase RimI-like enzyme